MSTKEEKPLTPAELLESYKKQLATAQAEAVKWTNAVHTLNGAIQALTHVIGEGTPAKGEK